MPYDANCIIGHFCKWGWGFPFTKYETNTFVKYFPFMRYARPEKGWDVHKIPVGHYILNVVQSIVPYGGIK